MLDDPLAEIRGCIAGCRVRLGPNVRDLRFERDVDELPIDMSQRLLALPPGRVAAVVTQLLMAPQRAYPGPVSENGRTVMLAGAFAGEDDEEEPVIAIARVETRLPVKHQHAMTATTLAVDVLDNDSDAIASAFETLYHQTALERRTVGKRPSLLWLGGVGEPEGTPIRWEDRVKAMAATFGVDAFVISEPLRAMRTIRAHLGATTTGIACVWLPRIGSGRSLGELEAALSGVRIAPIKDWDPDLAILDARWELDGAYDELLMPVSQRATSPPRAGETRHFKKHYAIPGRDVMIEVGPCSHETFEPAGKAPKALKGIEHRAGAPVRRLEKCVECTGGGHWRATF